MHHHHARLLAPHSFDVHGSIVHDIARTVLHAAVWRVLWSLPLPVVLCAAAVAVAVLLLGKRRVRAT